MLCCGMTAFFPFRERLSIRKTDRASQDSMDKRKTHEIITLLNPTYPNDN